VSLLRLERATFRYAGSVAPALVEATLEVRAGELVALAGRPGSGTSTLLLVAGGYAPRLVGGTLEGSRDIGARRPAIVFATPWTQLTGLCHTVFAEVAFGPASHGLSVQHIREITALQLARLGIEHLAARDPATLSGGELQRTIVAAALALEPDLLLLDDPGAELDPAAADAMYELFATLAAQGVGVMVATPDTQRASRVASRAVVLEGGRIVHDGVAGPGVFA
jgi:energy-coupling factor transporter ATP-binding protein EcfA2